MPDLAAIEARLRQVRKRAIKMSDKDFEDYRAKRLGKGTYGTADLAALRDLRGDLYHAR